MKLVKITYNPVPEIIAEGDMEYLMSLMNQIVEDYTTRLGWKLVNKTRTQINLDFEDRNEDWACTITITK